MLRQLITKLQMLCGGVAPVDEQSHCGNTTGDQPATGWLARGLALRRTGDREAALDCFRRAVDLRHDDVVALRNQAEVQLELGRHEDSADNFELALAFAPDHVPVLMGLARLRRETGECDAALRLLERAAHAAPGSAEPYFEMALTHNRQGHTGAALSSYGRTLELEPDHAAACVNAGLIHLAQLGDADRARAFFERAIALQPDCVAAQANLGLALQEQGLFEAALRHYNRLIELHPDVTEYRWNRGIALLSRGDYANGWTDYELRNARAGKSVARRFPLAEWDGSALTDRHVLIYGEQGLGDEIMFASCVPELLRRAHGVVLECDVRLAPLFRRSFPAARVHGAPRDERREWLQAFPELSVQVAAGSLPRFLRRNRSDFPRHDGYLKAEVTRRMHWRSRLAALGGGLKVGVGWHGGTLKTRRELRSLALADCLPLLRRSDCEFVCLQGGDCNDEIAAARARGGRMHWWPEATCDIDALAALISTLDAVVAVDSTLAHLSGALGQTVWTMLPASPDWRYLSQGERMPWYPSMQLFRQVRPGDWLPVVESVAAELERLARDCWRPDEIR